MRLPFLILTIFSFIGAYPITNENLPDSIRNRELYPFLQKDRTYIYVNQDFVPVLTTPFTKAGLFTSTGYALVDNEKGESAILNKAGEIVVPFADRYLSLQVLNEHLTAVYERTTFFNKKRFWNWKWSIFSGLNTAVKRQKYKVSILETKQVLYLKNSSSDESLPSYIQILNEEEILFNQSLYKLKGKRLKKQKSNVLFQLTDDAFLQKKGSEFTIMSKNLATPAKKNLVAADQLSFTVSGERIELNEINKNRYYTENPTILWDTKKQVYLIEPNFDKAFPTTITVRNQEDINYLKKLNYIRSIPDYPYFILGVFDYDTWTYSWKYISEDGQFLDRIDAVDFFVVDQIGRIQRPPYTELLSSAQIPTDWKAKSLTKFGNSNYLFKVALTQKGEANRYGLWNTKNGIWELSPIYRDFFWLDATQDLIAIAEEDHHYQLYDYGRKRIITSAVYNNINTDGWVSQTDQTGETLYFYLDFATLREYRAQ